MLSVMILFNCKMKKKNILLLIRLTFDVSKITKNTFYTLNIDHITKPQKVNVKNKLIQHMKQKQIKILYNHGVPFAQLLRKKRQNLCRQSLTFNDEPQIFFLKVVIDAIKMSMTFLFFAFFCMSPAKSPPNPRDHYPPTLRITPQPWRSATLPSLNYKVSSTLIYKSYL